jgi:uncharacterized protein (UPF0147 family)
MFMHMLGYPTHFGQMECVKLIAASGFAEKRVGYLGLMILLDERQEVTMLVTNSIKNDLAHKNHFVVGLALCSLGNICTAEMARDVAPEVAGLLSSKSSYVRKKAALCAIRVVKKVPELSDGFAAGASDLLADRHHGVLLCAVSLAIQLCRVDPAHLPTFRAHVPTLVRILKSLIHSGYSAEHDVGGHADPFLQAKLLRFLTVLGSGDAEASDQMSDVLANVASNTDGSKNAGCAILYEAVNAIVGVESIGGLRVLAVNILGRFLAGRDNNARYVALNALSKVVQRDAQAVQRHRHTIVECVKDSDVTIRRSALQLVYNLVNEKNIETLARELLEYLAVADEEFKGDLAKRISQLVATFAPNPRWHVDTMCDLLVRGGSHVADEECRAFVRLLTRLEEPLRGYAARALFRAACEERSHFQLLAVAAWVLGEYGDEGVGPGRLEGEPRTVVTKGDVCKLLESMLSDPHAPRAVRRVAVTSLAKLSARFPDELEGALRAAEKVSGSVDVELQQRASEFVRMFERGEPAARALLERMPPFEAEKNDPRSGGAGSGGASGGGGERRGGDVERGERERGPPRGSHGPGRPRADRGRRRGGGGRRRRGLTRRSHVRGRRRRRRRRRGRGGSGDRGGARGGDRSARGAHGRRQPRPRPRRAFRGGVGPAHGPHGRRIDGRGGRRGGGGGARARRRGRERRRSFGRRVRLGGLGGRGLLRAAPGRRVRERLRRAHRRVRVRAREPLGSDDDRHLGVGDEFGRGAGASVFAAGGGAQDDDAPARPRERGGGARAGDGRGDAEDRAREPARGQQTPRDEAQGGVDRRGGERDRRASHRAVPGDALTRAGDAFLRIIVDHLRRYTIIPREHYTSS